MHNAAQDNTARSGERAPDGDTRHQILLTLLKHAPITAGEIAEKLKISAAGVRRHLDILLEEEMAEAVRRTPAGDNPAPRGRPAKFFQLTDRGREKFGHDYDSLAQLALELLRERNGDEAIYTLAQERIASIFDGLKPVGADGRTVEDLAKEIAEAFDEHGYAASIHNAGGGVQICQHHCPIASVAAQYPELCEAEHEKIAELTGSHVQPLASIAHGNVVCTTNIPLRLHPAAPDERSGS